jgi:hypothetical protein
MCGTYRQVEEGNMLTPRERIAAMLLTLIAIVYGIIPLLVDLTPTHIFHPLWTPHARFHVVWQISVNTMLGLLTVGLAWWPGPNRSLRLKLASLLGCIALGGFVVAALTSSMYGGSLSEPGGVPPVAGMDVNALVFLPALVIQLIAVGLALSSSSKSDGSERRIAV